MSDTSDLFTSMDRSRAQVAVIIPCRDEEATVVSVIDGFRRSLPGAHLVVVDNASVDRTSELARSAGAFVIREPRSGKGFAVRRAFAEVEADVYLLVDGDATYDPAAAPVMALEVLKGHADLVNARRVYEDARAERQGHVLGNRLLSGAIRWLFRSDIRDMLTGYKAFSRRLVKAMPLTSTGFEIETEMTVHALSLRAPIVELDAPYRERPAESFSKLRTFRDGSRILLMIGRLLVRERPLFASGVAAAAIAVTAVLIGAPVIVEFMTLGLVLKIPSAVLASALAILSFLMLVAGLVLDESKRSRHEVRYLTYLSTSRRT